MTIKKLGVLLLCTLFMCTLVTGTVQPTAEATVFYYPQVDGGWYHTIALKMDGTVWVWGDNRMGQLGDGTTTGCTVPQQVPGLTNVRQIKALECGNIALKADGTVWAWGHNNFGQVGNGTTTDVLSPVQILSGVCDIDASESHSFVIKNDGTLWAWGRNDCGQIGDGTLIDKTSPVQITTITDVISVAAGYLHTIALKGDGTVWGWGRNHFGQLGNGYDSYVEVLIPDQMLISDVVDIDTGKNFSLMIKSDGSLWSCGWDGRGNLGDGGPIIGTGFSNIPVQVINLGNVIEASAGMQHTLVLRSDSTVWACGYNYYGQLGDNSTIVQSAPVQTNSIYDVISIDTGKYHSLAVQDDGSVCAWGRNNWGQLGDGTTADKHVPTEIPNFNLFN